MSELLIQTRITPPKTNSNIIARSRLTSLLNKSCNSSLVLMCAPAGYGKTTALLEYLKSSVIPFAWFSAPSDGLTSFSSMLDYLIHSLKKINVSFGNKTLRYLELTSGKAFSETDSAENIKNCVAIFVNEFCSSFTEDVYLVLDDFHYLHDEKIYNWLSPAINSLIENLPSGLRLIISTREVPDINISGLIASRNILVIGEKELAFNSAEIKQLLKNIYEIEISGEDVSIIEKELRGWVTGIHLLMQKSGKHFKEIKQLISEKGFATDSIFSFFAEVIFNRIDDEIKNFLISTSFPDYIEKNLCDNILGITDSEKYIFYLVNRNLFLLQTEISSETGHANRKIYSYHTLFKQFLLSKLSLLKSENEIKQLFSRTAEYFVSTGKSADAVKYFIKASDYNKAAKTFYAIGDKLISENKYELFSSILNLFPEETVKNEPHLLYYKSLNLNIYKGDLKLSLEYINKALEVLKDKPDRTNTFTYIVRKAEMLTYLGDYSSAQKTLRESEYLCDTPVLKCEYLYQLSRVLQSLLCYDEAIKNLLEALELSRKHESELSRTRILVLLGTIFLAMGDYVKALSYYEKIDFEKTNFIREYITVCNLSELYSYTGEFRNAHQYLQRAEELISAYPGIFLQIFLLLSKAYYYFEKCNFEESIEILKIIKPLAEKSNFKYYVFHCCKFIGLSYYYLGEINKAEQYYHLADQYAYEEAMLHDIRIQKVLPELKPRSKNLNEAGSVLSEAYGYFSSNKLIYFTAQSAFFLGRYHLCSGAHNSALQYFKISLELCQKHKYDSFLLREILYDRKTFDFIISCKLEKNYIKNMINWATELSSLSSEDVMAVKYNSDSVYDLRLKCFGVMQLMVRGADAEENVKLRAVSKKIISYLLINPQSKLTKDVLTDTFFGNISTDTLDSSFHQVISNIRKAVKQEYTEFILYENKILSLNPDYLYYSDCREFNKLYDNFFSSGDDTEKINFGQSLLRIYTGDFMEGFYENWVEELRHEYKNKFIRASENLLSLLYKKNAYNEAIIYSIKLLKHDMLNEEAHRIMILSYGELGDFQSAKKSYSKMTETFQIESGSKPPASLLRELKQFAN